MPTQAPDDFDAYLTEQMKDPEFLAAYEDAAARESVMDALVAARKSAGLSQTEVARRMGIRQPTLSAMENEGPDPRLSTLFRYARAVGLRLHVNV